MEINSGWIIRRRTSGIETIMTGKVLLTGGSGQVGTALQKLEWAPGISLLAPTRKDLDLGDHASISRFLSDHQIASIINSGAYTAVDAAESDRDAAWKINAEAPGILAEFAARRNISLIHISTDYVFPGNKESPYQEDDPVGPVSVYGMSKEAGERAVRTHCTKHVILRTAWVLSATGRNFLTTMLQLAETRDVLNVVADQHGSPTSASDIARVVKVLVEGHFVEKYAPCGTYHCVNSGYGTWADLAEKIFEISKNLGGAFAQVKRITTADYPTAARRPCNSQLLTDKLKRDFGQKLPHWHDAISPIVRDVLKRVS